MTGTTTHTTNIDAAGGALELTERNTGIGGAWGPVGVGLGYRRPTGIEFNGEAVTIPDHLMRARITALIVVAFAWLLRRMRR